MDVQAGAAAQVPRLIGPSSGVAAAECCPQLTSVLRFASSTSLSKGEGVDCARPTNTTQQYLIDGANGPSLSMRCKQLLLGSSTPCQGVPAKRHQCTSRADLALTMLCCLAGQPCIPRQARNLELLDSKFTPFLIASLVLLSVAFDPLHSVPCLQHAAHCKKASSVLPACRVPLPQYQTWQQIFSTSLPPLMTRMQEIG